LDLSFEKKIVVARFRNPNNNFESEEQVIEYRKDPLLGRLSIIPHELKKKASFYYGIPDKRALKQKVEESRANCFFCPERIDQVTAKFPEEINKEGRIRVGKATCFQNIFPFYEYCAVVTITDEHYLPLKRITTDLYGNALKAALLYIRKVHEIDKKAKYAAIGANFLLPAGSTIIHPHIQVIMGQEELYRVKLIREASINYEKTTGKNYWSELLHKERELGERYITQTENVHWYTPFAPLGNNEVRAVIENSANFLDLSEADIKNFGKGIANVLHYYHKKNISSFNFLFHSAPLMEKTESQGLALGWQIISRPPFRAYYINIDSWFIQQLAYGSLIIEFPETIAQDLRSYFNEI